MTPDRRAALVALKDAVEVGNATRTTIEEMAAGVFGLNTNAMDVGTAYAQGSTDAALALLGAVLPGWGMGIIGPMSSGEYHATVLPRQDDPPEYHATNLTPARAMLLATLVALIEQEARDG